MDVVKQTLNGLRTGVNNSFSTKEPWQIVTITATTVLATVWLWEFIFQEECVTERAKKFVFKLVRKVPKIRNKIDTELKKLSNEFEQNMTDLTKDVKYLTVLPPNGLSDSEVLRLLNQNLEIGNYDWKHGKVSGTVYFYNKELIHLVTEVYGQASYTNPLHPDVFPGVCKMEAEVVRMVANLFHGGEDACGTVTTGGTESILMACKAFRDYGAEVKGIKRPEIVVPVTAHSAFHKAALYLKLRIRSVPVDPVTTQVDIRAMKRAINRNTVLLVSSAPNFPYGTMDDIEAISDLGVKYDVPVHVDACLGGFLIIFMSQAGYPLPLFDFQLPGVKSISADTHKYGFAPKGSSVVLYSERKYRHYQFTVTTDWPGGVYGSPTVGGSRAGGIIASCWATIIHFGNNGYVSSTREIIHTTQYIEKQLRSVPGIFIFGKPATSVIALGSDAFDIYRLSDALNQLGWNLNVLQYPPGIHLCVTHVHTQPGVADQFITDVKSETDKILKNPTVLAEGRAALYGAAQKIPDRSIVGDFTRAFIDSMYYTPRK